MNAPIPAVVRPYRRLSWLVACALLFACGTASAQTTYIWTGKGYSNWADNPDDISNWANNTPPPNTPVQYNTDITDTILRFGDSRRTFVQFDELYAHRLEIVGNTRPYHFAGYEETLHLGSGGVLYNPVAPMRSMLETPVQLHGSQTWTISQGTLEVLGPLGDSHYDETAQTQVFGNYTLTKEGAGNLALMYMANPLTGGVNLNAGTLSIAAPSFAGLGLGPLTFDGGTLAVREYQTYNYYDVPIPIEFGYDYPAVLVNDVVSNGLLSFRNDSELVLVPFDYLLGQMGETELPTLPIETTGTLTLNADTTLRVEGEPLFIGLDVVEANGARKLTVDGHGATILYGSSGWTGGTQVDQGILIFAGEDNTPGIIPDENDVGGITVGSAGYVGIGADNNIAGFLSEINPASTGTIGFDTPPSPEDFGYSEYEIPTAVFGSRTQGSEVGIDLSNLPNVRLGSVTEAVIDGVITPAGNDYRFGGGGGYLFVNSPLTGARSVNVTSLPERPLTVILGNDQELPLPTNDFTGDVTVQNSALVFLPGTQPTPTTGNYTGNYTLQTGGYIGLMDSNQADFLGRFPSTTNTGIIGFDDMDWMDVTTTLDFTDFQPGVYFGTHTNVTFSGLITAAADSKYRFAAFKGGTLVVASELSGANTVHIGDPISLGTFGNPVEEEISSVILTGDNSHTGDTILYTGHLGVGQSNGPPIDPNTQLPNPTTALGTGDLIVQPHNLTLPGEEGEDFYPLLSAEHYDMVIPNAIVLNNGLEIGGNKSFTLAGNISGTGELYLGSESFDEGENNVQEGGGYRLTLSGNNANFSGGIYVGYGTSLTLTTDTAAGTGPLGFGYSGGYVEFTSPNPSVGGLWSDGSWAEIDLGEAVQTLTINQQEFGTYRGDIYGYGPWKLVKTGAETLRFDNAYILTAGVQEGDYNIGLDIQQGAVVFTNHSRLVDTNYYSTPAIRLSGGTFATDGDTEVNNPIVVANGGRLAGFGSYGSNVSIGDGAILSPGLDGAPTGLMHFNHLELDAGGIFEFNVIDPDPTNPLGQDRIHVYGPATLVINSTLEDPFTIKVISLDPSGNPGTLTGVDQDHGIYSWVLFSYDSLSIPGLDNIFDPDLFSLDLTGFSSDAPLDGDFTLFLDEYHSNIMLGFTPVPEPSTYALMALGLGFVGWTVWRRRRQG